MIYPAYPEVKPSGVEWLEDVPQSWIVKRMRYACHLNPSKSEVANLPAETPVSFLPMEKVGTEGETLLDENRAIEDVLQGFTYFRDGDIIAAKITPCFENGKGAIVSGLTNSIGFGSTEFHVLRPSKGYFPRFIYYLTKSHPFRSLGMASMYGAGGQKRVPEDFVEDFLTAFPTLSEQEQIAAFLDRKTSELDAVLRLKERQLQLLAEKRQALISQAVTRGLDPTASVKPSGVEWLGDVPAHWKVVALNYRYDVQLGKMLDATRVTGNHLAPYLRNVDVQWDRVNTDDLPTMDFLPADRERLALQDHDLLVCEGGEVGRCAIWHSGIAECYYQKAIHRLRPSQQGEVPRFLFYVLFTTAKRGVFVSEGNPNTIDHLPTEKLKKYRFAFPPTTEQQAIVTYLDRETARMDGIAQTIQAQIEKVREYRQALISAAVTGKIDVRER